MSAAPHLAIFSGLGTVEFLALILLGILLYGKNLPTVARTVGRTIGEFRRQMRDVETQIKREAFDEELRTERRIRPVRRPEPRDPEPDVTAGGPPLPASSDAPPAAGGNGTAGGPATPAATDRANEARD